MPYTHRVLPLKRASSSPSALPPLAATLTAGSVSRPVQLRSRAAIRSVASARKKRGDVVVFYCVRFGALYTHVSAPITARRGGGGCLVSGPSVAFCFPFGCALFSCAPATRLLVREIPGFHMEHSRCVEGFRRRRPAPGFSRLRGGVSFQRGEETASDVLDRLRGASGKVS